GDPSCFAKWCTRKYAPSAPSSSAATARSIDCSNASEADRACEPGDDDQCPNDKKPIFFTSASTRAARTPFLAGQPPATCCASAERRTRRPQVFEGGGGVRRQSALGVVVGLQPCGVAAFERQDAHLAGQVRDRVRHAPCLEGSGHRGCEAHALEGVALL